MRACDLAKVSGIHGYSTVDSGTMKCRRLLSNSPVGVPLLALAQILMSVHSCLCTTTNVTVTRHDLAEARTLFYNDHTIFFTMMVYFPLTTSSFSSMSLSDTFAQIFFKAISGQAAGAQRQQDIVIDREAVVEEVDNNDDDDDGSAMTSSRPSAPLIKDSDNDVLEFGRRSFSFGDSVLSYISNAYDRGEAMETRSRTKRLAVRIDEQAINSFLCFSVPFSVPIIRYDETLLSEHRDHRDRKVRKKFEQLLPLMPPTEQDFEPVEDDDEDLEGLVDERYLATGYDNEHYDDEHYRLYDGDHFRGHRSGVEVEPPHERRNDYNDAHEHDDDDDEDEGGHQDEQDYYYGDEQGHHDDEQDHHGDEQDHHGDEQDHHGKEQDHQDDEQDPDVEQDHQGDEQDHHGDEQDHHGDEQDYHGYEEEDLVGDERDSDVERELDDDEGGHYFEWVHGDDDDDEDVDDGDDDSDDYNNNNNNNNSTQQEQEGQRDAHHDERDHDAHDEQEQHDDDDDDDDDDDNDNNDSVDADGEQVDHVDDKLTSRVLGDQPSAVRVVHIKPENEGSYRHVLKTVFEPLESLFNIRKDSSGSSKTSGQDRPVQLWSSLDESTNAELAGQSTRTFQDTRQTLMSSRLVGMDERVIRFLNSFPQSCSQRVLCRVARNFVESSSLQGLVLYLYKGSLFGLTDEKSTRAIEAALDGDSCEELFAPCPVT